MQSNVKIKWSQHSNADRKLATANHLSRNVEHYFRFSMISNRPKHRLERKLAHCYI